MPRKKAEQPAEIVELSDTPIPGESEQPKPKKQSQKEPYKPFLFIADLGRSSCKSLIYCDGSTHPTDKILSCVVRVDSHPGNDFGGFTVEIEKPTGDKDDKGKDIKAKSLEHWVVGQRALAYPDHVYMTDKADSKVEYFHILLLGVLATFPDLYSLSTGKSPKQRTLTVDLATLSIADGATLKQSLKHCKSITVAGIKYRLNFTSNQQSFAEGHGAAIHGKNLFSDRNTLYVADLGAGTFQIAEYGILNDLPSKKSKDSYHGGGGITSLKREVTKALSNGDSSHYLNQQQVSTILENSCFDGEKILATDFSNTPVGDAILTAINQWLRDSPAQFALEELTTISRISPIVFCGGGFEIAPVKELIRKKILASGGNDSHLIFPEKMGIIGVKGVLDYIVARTKSNVIQLQTKEDECLEPIRLDA